jgi:hypothetical protein
MSCRLEPDVDDFEEEQQDAVLATLLEAQQVEAAVAEDPETERVEELDRVDQDLVAVGCHREDADPILEGDQASDRLEWCPSQ